MFTEVLLRELSNTLLNLLLLILKLLALVLSFFKLILNALSSSVMLFALGIEGRKILLALWNGLPAKLLLELCEFGFISFLDSIIDTAISVGSLSTATLINFLFKLIMLSFDLLMLVVAGSDLVLDSLDFLHEIIKLTLILNIKFIHLLLRLVLDCLSRCQRALGVAVVFSDIL